eukprot:CAMPEP_0201556730 /NCGR_PEP_ID=MMETSP0173_2-20130828/57410_1 /ASSEMBLY_ACC=CAM_ASM_000268 /TAXON_ID=218659 /ORGANISM="Vexillifera sp., Strain DIVA3 564/2" /LENGTH=149 /DNA_ID=CAMNT_0047969187 /DNA_START=12 /DNA_END=461 /DNA_ORIENTATION=+
MIPSFLLKRSVAAFSQCSRSSIFFQSRTSSTIPINRPDPKEIKLQFNEAGERVFTRAEVEKHHTADDCWIIIHDRVYNVTSWVEKHPGGDAIGLKAGQDSTDLFENQAHSDYARKHMEQYEIGVIAEPHRYTLHDTLRGVEDTEVNRPF